LRPTVQAGLDNGLKLLFRLFISGHLSKLEKCDPGNRKGDQSRFLINLKADCFFQDNKTIFKRGLEFRAVAVMACDDEIIPLQSRIEAISDGADLEEVYNTERHLLYGTCTRARDRLLVSAVNPESEFLVDLGIA
jgi:hypothetical protein